MNGSNGNIAALLERIAEGQERSAEAQSETNRELVRLNVRVEQLAAGMERAQAETNSRLDQLTGEVRQTNRRLDNVIDFMGTHHRDHEERLQALEGVVFKKPD